jgi:hypothetical protein
MGQMNQAVRKIVNMLQDMHDVCLNCAASRTVACAPGACADLVATPSWAASSPTW